MARNARRKPGDNNEKDFQGIGCEIVDWISMLQVGVQWRPLVNTAINIRAP
jgi:hypothetical protein